MMERSGVQALAGVMGSFSSPGSTFCFSVHDL